MTSTERPAGDAVIVRPLTDGDLEAVQAVETAAGERFRSVPEPSIAACADHPPMPVDVLRGFVADDRAWVVVDDGAVVGFLVVAVVDGGAHVEEVAVHPGHGGRGHATRLLDRAAAWADEHGAPAVTLTTFRDVPWNRPFYERRGFRVLGEEELSEPLRELFLHEEQAYGLRRALRVVMRRDLRRPVRLADRPRRG